MYSLKKFWLVVFLYEHNKINKVRSNYYAIKKMNKTEREQSTKKLFFKLIFW